ncbi:actin depolymerizing factor 11, partial [Perilla frutescens var. frutescens]
SCCARRLQTKVFGAQEKRNYRYIVFKFDDGLQQVVVEKVGGQAESHLECSNNMSSDDCRNAVFNYDFTTDENCCKSKIFFVACSPETAKVRTKMLYASSKYQFKRELDGIQVELQATDASEMSMDIFKERAY